MELEEHWENPPCVARVGARINDQEWPGAQCDCRQPFKWENGTQEGLTRLSTLYCKSMKGFITFDDSGQTSEGGSEEYSEYVIIPQDERQIGTFMMYMGWNKITSKSSLQYKMKEDAMNTGRASFSEPEYYAMVDGRIVIATKENIGGMLEVSVGDYVDVDFQTKDGTKSTYECIIGEAKGPDAPNDWGHNDGKAVVEILYYNSNSPEGYDNNKNDPWGVGQVLKISKTGENYFDE